MHTHTYIHTKLVMCFSTNGKLASCATYSSIHLTTILLIDMVTWCRLPKLHIGSLSWCEPVVMCANTPCMRQRVWPWTHSPVWPWGWEARQASGNISYFPASLESPQLNEMDRLLVLFLNYVVWNGGWWGWDWELWLPVAASCQD